MNGPEHYAKAERLVNAWQNSVNEIEAETDDELRREFEQGSALANQTLAAAQVHAKLAEVALQASATALTEYDWADAEEWARVTRSTG